MANPVCSICAHDKRTEIDAALIDGLSVKSISEQYGFAVRVVYKHRSKHAKDTIIKVLKQRDQSRQLVHAKNATFSAIETVTKLHGLSVYAILEVKKMLDSVSNHDKETKDQRQERLGILRACNAMCNETNKSIQNSVALDMLNKALNDMDKNSELDKYMRIIDNAEYGQDYVKNGDVVGTTETIAECKEEI